MSTTEVILVAALVVIVALGLWWSMREKRRRDLRERFGDEYDTTVVERGSTRAAERELLDRTARHEQLHITPLDRDRRVALSARWRDTQAHFVDEPSTALGEADELVQEVMRERGYPVGDFEQRTADLSVEHADVLGHYRDAHEIAVANDDGRASTEDLRRGMVHFRALFAALLDDPTETDDQRRTA